MVGKIDNNHYYVDLDRTTYNGILRFSKEITIWINRDGDTFKFESASAITSGGWFTYNTNEQAIFENQYPGCIGAALAEIKEYMQNWEVI